MGFYLSVPVTIGKAAYLKEAHGAIEIAYPQTLAAIQVGKAVVCVVENEAFDAALYIYNTRELDRALSNPQDVRRRTWLIMDESLVRKLAGYQGGEVEWKDTKHG